MEHIRRLGGKERIEQLNALGVSMRKLVHAVYSSKGKKDQKFKVAVEECFNEMTEDLAGISGRQWEPCVDLKEQVKVHCDAVLQRLKAEEEDANQEEEDLQNVEDEVIAMLQKMVGQVEKRRAARGRRRRREEKEWEEAQAKAGREEEEEDNGGGKPCAKRRKTSKVN